MQTSKPASCFWSALSRLLTHLQVVGGLAVCGLQVRMAMTHPTSGEEVSVHEELFTTENRLLSLSLRLKAECNNSEATNQENNKDPNCNNKTTEEPSTNVSLPTAGSYKAILKVFNPVTRSSYCTHVLVRDPAGELLLNISTVITTRQERRVSFRTAAGPSMNVSLLVNATLLYRVSSHTTGEEATAALLSNHSGTVAAGLRAENQVSFQNKSPRMCVEGSREPSAQVRVNQTWQPPTSHSPAHGRADNGEEVPLTPTERDKNL